MRPAAKSCRRANAFLAAILIGLIGATIGESAQASPVIEEEYRGAILIAYRSAPERNHDIDLVGLRAGLDIVKQALDLIYERSAATARAIDDAKKAGRVLLVYDPDFPKAEFAKLTLAAFSTEIPDALASRVRDTGAKSFVATFSRFIAKHEIEEIAGGGIAHELAGHGTQHRRGNLRRMRVVDAECEAGLYELRAYDDIGADMLATYIIEVRRETEFHWCDDFRRYMRRQTPDSMALWDDNPLDVDRLLGIFATYLRATGS